MKLHPIIKDLIHEIETFRDRKQISISEAGKLVAKDANFVRALKMGRSPSVNTIERARRIMKIKH